MGPRDKRVDGYIKKAPPFAQPILNHLREIIHGACPEVEETIKWGHPFFQYRGMLCHMAAFKAHVAFGFWKAKMIIEDKDQYEDAMGQFGKITTVKALPSKRVIAGYIKRGMALNESGTSARIPRSTPRAEIPVPPDFLKALSQSASARRTFESLPPSHKREYLEWITEAKRETTRQRRLATAIEWLSEGKDRNGKVRPGR